jgi:hypothetical protein
MSEPHSYANGREAMWQKVALFLAGIIVTLGAVQVTNIRNGVSRTDMVAFDERESSYARDKQVITLKLETIAADQAAMRQQLDALRQQIDAFGRARRGVAGQ